VEIIKLIMIHFSRMIIITADAIRNIIVIMDIVVD
jgi:hypothetical protein